MTWRGSSICNTGKHFESEAFVLSRPFGRKEQDDLGIGAPSPVRIT